MILNSTSTKNITALYAETAGSCYALRSVGVSLGLGAVSSCRMSVICEVDRKRLTSSYKLEELSTTTDVSDLIAAFKYGDRVKVKQLSDVGEMLLFDGYVTVTSTSVSSAVGSFAFDCNVVLQSPAALYNNEATHINAYWCTANPASNGEFAALGVVAADAVNAVATSRISAADPFNPAKFAANCIDATVDLRKTEIDGFDTVSKSYEKLSSFIDLATAPSMDFTLVGGEIAQSKESAARSELAARISETDILTQLQSNSGLAVFNAHIAQFGLVLAPRVGKLTRAGEPSLAVIPNIGINSDVSFKVTPADVVGYSDQPPQHSLGKYHAVAVRISPYGVTTDNSAVNCVLWAAGHDKNGKPKLYGGVKLNAYDDKHKRDAQLFKALGPITVLQLPRWLTCIGPNKGSKNNKDHAALFENYANARAKTYYAQGLFAPGRVTVRVLYSELDKFYNHIGDEAEIDLSSVADGVGTKLEPKYGRLIGVNYHIAADATAFTASCALDFDCVCTKEEHAAFAVSAEGMLCTTTK